MRTKRLCLMMAATAVLASCGSAASAGNPLIGRWHLVSWLPSTNPNWLGPQCNIVDMVFTPTTSTIYTPDANPSVPVSYNVQPRRVVVSSANDVIYYLIDATHIQRDDGAKCTYQRAS